MYKIVLYYDFFHLTMYYELYVVIKYCFMTWFETAKWHYIVQTEMQGTI